MNIGEEQEAIELPIPVDPMEVPVEQPAKAAPIAEPVPAHASHLVMASSVKDEPKSDPKSKEKPTMIPAEPWPGQPKGR